MLSNFRLASLRSIQPSASIARTYASAAKIQVPIQLFGVAGTYATALYTAAAKQNALEPTYKHLQTLEQTLERDPKVVQLIGNPTLSKDDKVVIVDVLSKQVGGDKIISNLLKVMSENNRLGMLGGVASSFSELMSAQRGEVEVIVTSAQALDKKTMSSLEASISKSKFAGQGRKLKISNKV